MGDWRDGADYARANQPPSLSYPLGTDGFGQPVLTKTILAARVSLSVGLVANLIAVPLGLALGMVSGYFGKWIDDVVVWLYTTVAAAPAIIRVVALKFAFQDAVLLEGTPWRIDLGGMAGLYLAVGLMTWIGTCRLVRAETMRIRELDYVLAARALGQGHFQILRRHVLPNVMHIGIVNFSLGFVGAVLAEVVLSYLGLGVPVGTPSWGTMISAARMELIAGQWWQLASAVGAMFVLVLAVSVLGDRLRDALDPKLKHL
jgi:peptide/nickel transport system permease protein